MYEYPSAPDEEPSAAPPDPELEQAVLAQLELERNQQSSWGNAILILVVSVMFFAGARDGGGWDSLWIIIPVLFFHELGHFATMRFFGYRNLKMFFIPFFGAAVSGRHYNVQGWKKALVALMGPLPGIVLGTGLGIAGLMLRESILVDIAMPMLVLNGFNLLPLMPFDGGWVLHAILFCRHPLLDLAFRLATIAALVGLGMIAGTIFFWIAGFMALTTPGAWQIANVAHRLRERDAVAASIDDTIPPATVRVILAELLAGKPNQTAVNILSQQVLSVFETLNSRPPDIAASLGLLVLHGGAFATAIVMAILLAVGQRMMAEEMNGNVFISPRLDDRVAATRQAETSQKNNHPRQS